MKSNILSLLLAATGIIILVSCNPHETSHNNEKLLARVGQSYLYASEVPDYFPEGLSSEDSIQMVKNYVKSWVTRELIVQHAEENLPNQIQKKILEQVVQTRNSLYIHHYEQAMINQKMDTIVADSTLQAFYDAHTDLFRLNNNIVKALYIQIPLTIANLSNVRKWYRSDKPEDYNKLEGYCFQYATKFDDFNEAWIPFSGILEKIPYRVTNQERFLRTNRFIEAKDSVYQYFVRINEYHLRGTPAPVEYVADEIKNTILNERKLTFIQELENNIYSDALNRNEFEIY
ncbi:MAG: hypothetical protein GXO83_08920 [Chlorobi bacterium]|nr:hypothetical protein [Chlorobiota bacterium]